MLGVFVISWSPLSCGHRHCPQCQNHEVNQWLDRQKQKLLPVDYFMVTFTLPAQLRELTRRNQKTIYSIFFDCVKSTLNDFGLNPKKLDGEMGLTAVLHTHNRKLDYHPHIHVVIPGGGINPSRNQWKKLKGKYLFNAFALAKVFRARFLSALNHHHLRIPHGMPRQWVVNVINMGKGLPALKYLSRYLYRGVINERNIIKNENGQVTFKYINSTTKQTEYRTLKGEDFLYLILRHVLPRGFRRVRDYGFLHANAKMMLKLVQLILHVKLETIAHRPRAEFKCPHCQASMVIRIICHAERSG
jgi:putative transposase/transposase-like zinc-binding protein